MKPPRLLFLAAAISALACGSAQLQAQTPQAATNATTFRGTVTGADGKPVAGAAVEYWEYSEALEDPFLPESSAVKKQAVTSGADGRFSFPISFSVGTILAKKAGLAPAWKLLNQTPYSARETEGKLEMMAPGILEGTVVDGSNKPVAGAEAFVLMAFDDQSQSGAVTWNALLGKQARDLFSARTDSAGRFRIENFPSNATAMLAAESPGKISRPPEDAAHGLESAGYRVGQPEIKLLLEPAGSIEGQITGGENNVPIAAAQLMLIPDSQQGFMPGRAPEKSTANGTFRFDRVLAGSYSIRASFGTNNDSGWAAETVPVTVTTGQTNRGVQIKAVRGTLLEVTVLNQTNRKPQPGVNVTAIQDESPFQGITDSNGVARVYALPGDYQVAAFLRPRSSGQTSATVEAGKTNRVEIELAETATGRVGSEPVKKISGIVHLPDGKPAVGASVQLISPGLRGKDRRTDANGKFELEWNPHQFGGQSDMTACVLARDRSATWLWCRIWKKMPLIWFCGSHRDSPWWAGWNPAASRSLTRQRSWCSGPVAAACGCRDWRAPTRRESLKFPHYRPAENMASSSPLRGTDRSKTMGLRFQPNPAGRNSTPWN